MVDIGKRIVFEIGIAVILPITKNVNEEWFDEDIVPLTSSKNVGAEIIVDFSFSKKSVVEYTLDSGTTWIKFNNGIEIDGGYSAPIRVTSGVEVNFRSTESGTLNRCIVS